MMPQVGSTENPQTTGLAPDHVTGHNSAAKKSLFSTLIALTGQQSKNNTNKPSPKITFKAHAMAGNENLSFHTNKTVIHAVIAHAASALVAEKRIPEKQNEQGRPGKASISGGSIPESGIQALSGEWGLGKQSHIDQSAMSEQIFPAELRQEDKRTLKGPQVQPGLPIDEHGGRKSITQTPDSKDSINQKMSARAGAFTGQNVKANQTFEAPLNADKTFSPGEMQQRLQREQTPSASLLHDKEASTSDMAQPAEPRRQTHENNGEASTTQARHISQTIQQSAHGPYPVHVQQQQPAESQVPVDTLLPAKQQLTSSSSEKKEGERGNAESTEKIPGAKIKQMALASGTHRDISAGRPASANDPVFTNNISSALKRFGQQPRLASQTAETGLDTSTSTMHEDLRLKLASSQKSHASHTIDPQRNIPAQRTENATLSIVGGAVEGSEHWINRHASISTRHSQTVPELYVLQAPPADTSSVAPTQHGKSILPQAHPGSGPWTVAAAMQEIGRAASQERFRIEFKLEPAHLGKIQVYLDSDARKQIQVHIVVDQNTSRQVIEQHLPSLRQTLAEQGLDMGGFSMASQQDPRGQSSDEHGKQHASNLVNRSNGVPLESTKPQQSTTNARLSIRI